MDPTERWQQTRLHFEEAVELPLSEREAYLDRVCEGDAALRAEIEELLQADAQDTGALPGEDATAGWLAGHVHSMLRGTMIGDCRIVGVLGSGGMGTVYEAEQDHPKRTVALKVMRPGNDEALHLEYFHREAELLASLRHPHVAQVYSAGVHEDSVDGRTVRMAYLVMEPVEDALDLVTYANRHELDKEQRVHLFLDVADALCQAHRRGLVHRDVKPSNLLVDGQGNVKVIDFGIARMVGSAQADIGTSGTLRYMSPEQKTDAASLDVRSDVYSLGVVLGELLLVTDPELEWVRAKATHQDPDQRYDHAGDLALDLRRRLTDFPVAAAPAGRGYRLRKFVRRHRLLVASSVLVFLSAIAGVGGLAMGYVEAAAQRETAEARAAEAEAVLAFIKNMLVDSQPWHGGGDVTVRQFLDRSAKSIDEEFADEPGVAAVLHETVGWALRGIGKPREAEPSLRRAVELMADLPKMERRRVLVAKHRFAMVMSELGKTPEAVELIAQVAKEASEHLGPNDELTRSALDLQAIGLSALGRAEEAVVIMKRLIEISDRQLGSDSKESMAHRNNLVNILLRLRRFDEAAEQAELTERVMVRRFGLDHVDTLVTMQNRAALLYFMGKYVEAEKLTRKALEHRAKLLEPEHSHLLIGRYWLGAALNGQKRSADARAVLEPLLPIVQRVQGADHSYALKTEIELAKALHGLGEKQAALEILRGVEKRLAPREDVSSQRLLVEVRGLLGEAAGK